MKKTDRKSQTLYLTTHYLEVLIRSKSGCCAMRNFEFFKGVIEALYELGEITEERKADLTDKALQILTTIRARDIGTA